MESLSRCLVVMGVLVWSSGLRAERLAVEFIGEVESLREDALRKALLPRLLMAGHSLVPSEAQGDVLLVVESHGKGLLLAIEGKDCEAAETLLGALGEQGARKAALVVLRLLEDCQAEEASLQGETQDWSGLDWMRLGLAGATMYRPGDISHVRYGGRLDVAFRLIERLWLGLSVLATAPLIEDDGDRDMSRLDIPLALTARFLQEWSLFSLAVDGGPLINVARWGVRRGDGATGEEATAEFGLTLGLEPGLRLHRYVILFLRVEGALLFSDWAYTPDQGMGALKLSPVIISSSLGLGLTL